MVVKLSKFKQVWASERLPPIQKFRLLAAGPSNFMKVQANGQQPAILETKLLTAGSDKSKQA